MDAISSVDNVKNFTTVKPVSETQSTRPQNEQTPQPQAEVAAAEAAPAPTAEDAEKLVANINSFVQSISTKLSFMLEPEDGSIRIMVVESETGKVIRQIPPEQLAKLNDKMDEIGGILFNRRA